MNRAGPLPVFVSLAALAGPQAQAHHSTFGVYDTSRVVEIEGTIKAVRWRNPHPTYTLTVTDADGESVDWQVETGAISTLRLRGLDEDFMAVGDRVTLAGEGSSRGLPELFARNLLRPDGIEVLVSASSRPRWSADDPSRLYRPPVDEAAAAAARSQARGIFRAWTSVFGDPDSFPLYGTADYPLTAKGQRRKSEWDPRASPYVGCGLKGQPYVMVTPYPLQFLEQDEDIVLHFEEFDVRRLIHMNADGPPPESQAYSTLGDSVGHWLGRTLVVETTRIEATEFYGDGTPQRPSMRTLEHFTLSADESRLDYHLQIEDPEIFAYPMQFDRYWAWRPEISVQPFGCEQ